MCGVKLEDEELCTSACAVQESNLRIRAQTPQLFSTVNSTASDKHSKCGGELSHVSAVVNFVHSPAVKSSLRDSLGAEAEQLDEAEDQQEVYLEV